GEGRRFTGGAARLSDASPRGRDARGAGETSTPSSAGTGPAYTLDGRLDLNRAGSADLDALPGVGPVTALRILEDRRVHGRLRRAEDLARVKGIGPKTLAKLLPHVTVRAAKDSS